MRTLTFGAALLLLVAGSTMAQVGAQDEKQGPQPAANRQVFIRLLCTNLLSEDARVRYSVIESLRTIGAQAVPTLNVMKTQTKNRYHKAFLTRTIKRIKDATALTTGNSRERGRQAMMRMFRGRRNLDIDRLAMEASLTFKQMAKVEPILKRTEKDLKELMDTFRESDGWRDQEAREALREEQQNVAKETKAALTAVVSGKQAIALNKQIDRYATRGGRGFGRGGRGRGGDRGDRRGGERRPDR